MNETTSRHHEHAPKGRLDWYRIGTWGAIGVMAFYLLTEHTAHVIAVLPYLLLAACPLMHFFMHGKHHDHGDGHRDHTEDEGDK